MHEFKPEPQYNASVNSDASSRRRVFSLQDAQQLLPTVKQLTGDTVQRAEDLILQIEALDEGDPERVRLSEKLDDLVKEWAARLQALGAEVKGCWLVDFDNGDGYYCWAWPEDTISHYHGYTEGFAGRMKIL
jgi:hypothetical protein